MGRCGANLHQEEMAALRHFFLWVSFSTLIGCFLGGNGQTSTGTSTPLMLSESGSGFFNSSTPLCTSLSHEFQTCSSLEGRMSMYQYEQFIPALESEGRSLTGNSLEITFTLINTFSPPPPDLCTDFLKHVLCYLAAPPCDPVSDLQLPICNDSCRAYNLLLSSNLCLTFNNSVEVFIQSTSVIEVLDIYDIYSAFNCDNSSTYFFRDGEGDEFASNGECTSLFTPSLQEQIFSSSMCVPVPTGICTVASETGYYIQNDRDSTIAFLALAEVQNDEFPSNCNNVLLKFICEYVFIPCNRHTGYQVSVCQSSCSIFERIMSRCFPFLNASLQSQQLLTEFVTFNCFDPSSYLLDNVPVDNELCIDLSSYVDLVPTESPTTESSPSIGGIIAAGVFVAILVILVAVVIFGCCLWQMRKSKEIFLARNDMSFVLSNMRTPSERYQLTTSNKELDPVEREDVVLTEADKKLYMTMFTPVLVSYVKLNVGDYIGEGAFGKVYGGDMQTSSDSTCAVAIKTIKNLTSQNELKAFFSESLIMKDFNHPNVLGLVGVCFDTPDDVPYIILPYMVNGSLKDYLKTKRVHITNVDTYPEGLKLPVLAGMCSDIAHGMDYLAEKRFVHRDLAARNCMVSETLAIKIGDFGLARDVYSSDYYRASKNAALPVKWMPPETLHDGISNERTDIWSFGVTCWEVFSLGRTPYPGVQNYDMIKFISTGGRLERPTLCPKKLHHLFEMCWQEKPEDRPTFNKLVDLLEEYFEQELSYVNDQ